MIQNLENTIREYLPQVIHLSLGTSRNNLPWVCEVHYVFDDDLNLYFRSLESRRHSQEIADNPLVAGNIVAQHTIKDKPRGVYFEGLAEKLVDVGEKDVAYQLYCQRFGTGPQIVKEALRPDGHKFYKISVSSYYVFDSRESVPSQKYVLKWKASQ
jgi:uncharacterized protein YhbP (UPF0306 family)